MRLRAELCPPGHSGVERRRLFRPNSAANVGPAPVATAMPNTTGWKP